MQTNFEHCAALVREADRDRYLATLFAPAEHRDALFALYAFNVEIARVRELAREPMPGEIRLQWWREVLSGERDGEAAAHPVAAALRETLARYGFVAAPLLELIDARTFDLYDEPMATSTIWNYTASRTQSPLFAMAAESSAAGAPPELFTLDAGIAYTIAGILMRLRAARGAAAALCAAGCARSPSGRTARTFSPGRRAMPLRAALAETAHAGAPASGSGASKAGIRAAGYLCRPCCRSRWSGRRCAAMERAGYDPFQLEPAAPWRRQWLLWRAARDPSRIFRRLIATRPRAGVRSSPRDPAIEIGERALAERALARQVLGRAAAEFAAVLVERRGSASGGNRPKFTFIGWNEDGPASMVSIWPPVICASSAPCAVVGGGGAIVSPRRSAAAKRAGEQADGGGFHIALAAGDLAGEAPARIGLQPQRLVEQLGRIEEGVAMQAAEPREFRVLQAGNGCGRCAPARRVSAWSGSRPC